MKEGISVESLAKSIGATEPALRLLISLLLGYPVAFFHRKFLYGKKAEFQHLYFIACGIGICCFNYGWDVIHSISAVTICYLVLKILGGGSISLAIVFIYTMAHLLTGYWTTATTDYDIKWTMPQCVLTLRLIGLAFNMSDGKIPYDKLSEENKKLALKEVPSVLEVFAHSFFPGSFLIGPQFPIRRYQDFVMLKLEKKENPYELPQSISAGLKNLALGLFYLGIYQVGSMYVTDDLITSEEYKNFSLWKQCILLGLWARLALYKYISCWLITEGSLSVIGITYNGVDENGIAKWDGCSNVKIGIFESATRMNHYIESFNINTNHWVAQYIYKRLKFLNNRVYSQFGVLFFLAVWHGFHSGYYATFFFEFISILSEKNVRKYSPKTDLNVFGIGFLLTPMLGSLAALILNPSPFQIVNMLDENEVIVKVATNRIIYPFVYVFLRLYTFVCMGYAMIPFILLKYKKYMPLFIHFYFCFHIFYISLIAFTPFLKKHVIRPKKRKDSSRQGSTSAKQD